MVQPSLFAALETSFRLLSQHPYPVAVDGRQLGHGPPGRSRSASCDPSPCTQPPPPISRTPSLTR
jgi:hypothetical protein